MAASTSDPALHDEIAARTLRISGEVDTEQASARQPRRMFLLRCPHRPPVPSFEPPKASPTMVSGAPPMPLSAASVDPSASQGWDIGAIRGAIAQFHDFVAAFRHRFQPIHQPRRQPTGLGRSAPPAPPPPDPELERKLFEALAAGDVDAGDQLASLLNGNPNRTQDVVAIRRRQVVLQPSSLRYLELLHDATRADHNPTHATAVHHVVCVLTGQTPPTAPPLQHQLVDPDRLLAMVGRGVHGAAAEVLGAIWQNASHLFVREPADYGLTGLERVALSSPSPLDVPTRLPPGPSVSSRPPYSSDEPTVR